MRDLLLCFALLKWYGTFELSTPRDTSKLSQQSLCIFFLWHSGNNTATLNPFCFVPCQVFLIVGSGSCVVVLKDSGDPSPHTNPRLPPGVEFCRRATWCWRSTWCWSTTTATKTGKRGSESRLLVPKRRRQALKKGGQLWKRVGHPWKRVGDPWRRIGNPWKRFGNPWQRVGNPWKRVGDPWKGRATRWTSFVLGIDGCNSSPWTGIPSRRESSVPIDYVRACPLYNSCLRFIIIYIKKYVCLRYFMVASQYKLVNFWLCYSSETKTIYYIST